MINSSNVYFGPNNKYELKVVSTLLEAKGMPFKQHFLGGKKVIGVDYQEPFMIRFLNNTSEKVQVRLSVDGTDILTGNPANKSSLGKMWLVKPWDKLEVKAWPEDNMGGAAFIFGDRNKGVAVNTHGNADGVGVIAAAVFVETKFPKYDALDNELGAVWDQKYDYEMWIGGVRTDEVVRNNVIRSAGAYDSFGGAVLTSSNIKRQKDPAVGAGEYVKQVLNTEEGLDLPLLDQTLEVHYELWANLHSKLQENYEIPLTPKAFPAQYKNIDLKNVPKQKPDSKRIFYRYF